MIFALVENLQLPPPAIPEGLFSKNKIWEDILAEIEGGGGEFQLHMENSFVKRESSPAWDKKHAWISIIWKI